MTEAVQGVVGIDLGGTNVRAGVLDADGRILSWVEGPIEAARGPRAGLERIAALTERALREAGPVELCGIGIGATGPVDREIGAIQNPYTLPTWENVDVVSPLRRQFGVAVALENDADAAILGEYWRGAGQGASRLYMVTVGTGIGTAFIADGKLYRGANGFHPEGGHVVIDPSGPKCYCGANGCWESLASGTAIARAAREGAPAAGSVLVEWTRGDLEQIGADLVARAAEAGDPFARQVIDRAAYYLGLGIVDVISLLFPERILLGGGVMRRFEQMRPIVSQTLAEHSVMVQASAVRLEPAQLGPRAGVIGAGYAAYQESESG